MLVPRVRVGAEARVGGRRQSVARVAPNERPRSSVMNTVTTTAPALEAHGVRRAFGAVQAVVNASLSVQPGSVTALIGPNGCGKTTLDAHAGGAAAARRRRRAGGRPQPDHQPQGLPHRGGMDARRAGHLGVAHVPRDPGHLCPGLRADPRRCRCQGLCAAGAGPPRGPRGAARPRAQPRPKAATVARAGPSSTTRPC